MTNLINNNSKIVTYFSNNEVLERLESRLKTVNSYELHELLEFVLDNSDCSGHYGYGYFINLPGVDVPVGFQTEDNVLTVYIQDNHCDESYISVNTNFDDVDFESCEDELEVFSRLYDNLVG